MVSLKYFADNCFLKTRRYLIPMDMILEVKLSSDARGLEILIVSDVRRYRFFGQEAQLIHDILFEGTDYNSPYT